MTQFSTSNQFASYVLANTGISSRWMNCQSTDFRMKEVTGAVLRLVRYGVEDNGVEYDYYAAAYGLAWAIETGRLAGCIVAAIHVLNTRELLQFIHTIRVNCAVIADVPRYIIGWYIATQEVA